jgi:hypothetical protein
MDARYPVGEFAYPREAGAAEREVWIGEIASLPRVLRGLAEEIGEGRLERSYRGGGWTARQVIHHVADSHLNGYARQRLALTEDTPVIKPYAEAEWARLEDARRMEVEPSLRLLESLHERWVRLLRSLREEDFARGYVHPEVGGVVTLAQSLANYAWHGRHHAAHLRIIRDAG